MRVPGLVRVARWIPWCALVAAGWIGNDAATCQVLVSGPLVRDVEVSPRDTVTGAVTLVNSTPEDQVVRVYLRDYTFDASGTTRYDPPGTLPRSAAPWIALGASELVVPAEGRIDVDYDAYVPAEPAPQGTWWAALMVEGVDAADGRPGTGLRARIRYAVQLVFQLGDAGPDLALTDVGIDDDVRQLWLDVANRGGSSADVKVSLELFGQEGGSLGRRSGGRARLYPDTSYRHRVALDGIAAGSYQALVIIETGDEHAVGAQFTLDL